MLIFGTENVVRVLDVATGLPRYAPLRHQDRCHDVRFSPDGRLVSTASFDNTVRVWELETGRPVSEPLRGLRAEENRLLDFLLREAGLWEAAERKAS